MTENGNRTNGTIAGNRVEMDRFLVKMRDSGNVRLSCKAADVNRSTVYRWRNKWSTFADEWDEALEDACDILEGKAWERAVNKGSDRLLMFLLKAHRPNKFKERIETEQKIKADVIIKHRPDLSKLTDAELAKLAEFAQRTARDPTGENTS